MLLRSDFYIICESEAFQLSTSCLWRICSETDVLSFASMTMSLRQFRSQIVLGKAIHSLWFYIYSITPTSSPSPKLHRKQMNTCFRMSMTLLSWLSVVPSKTHIGFWQTWWLVTEVLYSGWRTIIPISNLANSPYLTSLKQKKLTHSAQERNVHLLDPHSLFPVLWPFSLVSVLTT